MAKIGRNDPCPCGSGKKYKHCCLGKEVEIFSPLPVDRGTYWSYEEIARMATEEIIYHLRSLGIEFTKDEFVQRARTAYSATEISEGWWREYTISAGGFNEDFPWLASWVLWERLVARENLCEERMNSLRLEGWDLMNGGDPIGASHLWLQIWAAIKYKLRQMGVTLGVLEDRYGGSFFVGNFVQDLEHGLRHAGLEDPTYFRKLIAYGSELLELLPGEQDRDIRRRHNLRRTICESYAYLGELKRAKQEFKALATDYPKNPWSFIAWGDFYHDGGGNDPKRAKELFQKALDLAQNDDDRLAAQERLEYLEKDQAGAERADNWR